MKPIHHFVDGFEMVKGTRRNTMDMSIEEVDKNQCGVQFWRKHKTPGASAPAGH